MRIRLLIAVLGWLALALPGIAQEESPDAPADDSPQASEDQDNEESEDDDADADADESADIDDFIFSEEIPADQQLVFPVDI